MSALKIFDTFMHQIQLGNFRQAREIESNCQPIGLIENRIKDHMRAKLYLIEGNFESCSQILEDTHLFNGTYIGTLCDLAVAYYYAGKNVELERTLKRIQFEFKSCAYSLSPINQIKTRMIIAKISEELGKVDSCIEDYASIVVLADSNQLFDYSIKASAQLLRLNAYFSLSENILSDYLRLHSSIFNSDQYDFCIEVEHALSVVETKLFGTKYSIIRLEKYLHNEKVAIEDKKLLLLDVIEILAKEDKVHEIDHITEMFNFVIKSLNQVELKIIDYLKDTKQSGFHLMELQSKLSVGSFARLALVSQSHATLILDFVNQHFDETTKRFWLKRIHKTKETNIECLKLSLDAEGIQYNGSLIFDYSRKQVSKKFLEAFKHTDNISTFDLAELIWEVKDADISYVSRLRDLMSRINHSLSSQIGLEPFSMLNDCVQLSSACQIV